MQPQTPGQPVQPAPTVTNQNGVQSVAPVPAPTMPNLPAPKAVSPVNTAVQNPSYNPSAALGDIANYYKVPQDAALATAAAKAKATQGGQQFSQQQFEAGVNVENLRDQLNPSKYTVKEDPKSQYGVSITNSLGQPVSLSTYVNLTGQNPAQVLQNSADPEAQKFVTAYTNFENLMKTKIAADGGDKQAQIALGDWYAQNPGLQNMTLQQVTNAFMSQYGQFFGQPQTAQPGSTNGVTPTFTSQNNPVNASPYYELSYYPGLAQATPQSAALLGGSTGAGNSSTTGSDLTSQLQALQQGG